MCSGSTSVRAVGFFRPSSINFCPSSPIRPERVLLDLAVRCRASATCGCLCGGCGRCGPGCGNGSGLHGAGRCCDVVSLRSGCDACPSWPCGRGGGGSFRGLA
jgi:hypothetical protein